MADAFSLRVCCPMEFQSQRFGKRRNKRRLIMGFNLGFTAILPVDHFDFLKRTFISYSKMFKHKIKRGCCETKTVLCYLSGARMI